MPTQICHRPGLADGRERRRGLRVATQIFGGYGFMNEYPVRTASRRRPVALCAQIIYFCASQALLAKTRLAGGLDAAGPSTNAWCMAVERGNGAS
jgi:hypothetical protein